MNIFLCISVRFIQPQPLFHGSGDAGDAEWPPSPMRVFQALLNAACLRTRGQPLAPAVRDALHVLEVLRPCIVAPVATLSTVGYRAYVPHNHADLVTAAWHRGNSEASIATHRTEKDYRPMRIHFFDDDLPAVHYLYPLDATNVDPNSLLDAIRPSVRSIHCLGWGIDQVVADAQLIDSEQCHQLNGERYSPTTRGGQLLRSPRKGSLDALHARHDRFLKRLRNGDWTPVPPLTEFDSIRYGRSTDPLPRPHIVFRLLDENDDTVAYRQSKFIHIAGMVRHLAIEQMKRYPPRDLCGQSIEQWIDRYVAGHQNTSDDSSEPHTQLSYIPLQSIGHEHTDPGVRRVMIVAPLGDETWLEHVARYLDGQELKADPKFPNQKLPPGTRLERIADRQKDGVRDAYLRASRTWASVTPVILPGHDDHKPAKTRKLIEKALAQSGIDQPCEFEWSPFSQFRKMLGAHKYVRDEAAKDGKRHINYFRPDHLLNQTAVHLVLRFGHRATPDDPQSAWIPAPHEISGPIMLGPGRHCGFGVLAAIDSAT